MRSRFLFLLEQWNAFLDLQLHATLVHMASPEQLGGLADCTCPPCHKLHLPALAQHHQLLSSAHFFALEVVVDLQAVNSDALAAAVAGTDAAAELVVAAVAVAVAGVEQDFA